MRKELWDQLRPLLDEVLDLPEEERAGWIAELRRERPTLAAELQSLLASDAGATGDLLRDITMPPVGSAMNLAGRTLGNYTLEKPIGHGGMGTVWLGRRNDGRFQGNVAIKLLNLALVGKAGEERFAREGTALARLTHPHIARLLDAGVSPDGQPFLVLEYVPGVSIDAYAADKRLTADQRIGLFLDVLSGVASAHANLIVHRDIKPSNIMVTAEGTAKLLDFGIAKMLDEGREITQGDRALTPEYAAPEQIRGEPVSTATDVYSLGVLLYILLGGRHPTGEGCHTPAEYLRATVDTEPRRLSEIVETPRLKRLFLGDLDNILAKALKKTPEERYPTVEAFAEDLNRFRAHQPVSARADSWSYRAGKFVRRNRAPVIAVSIAILALMAGTVVSLRQAAVARRERDRATEALKRAEASTKFESLIFRLIEPGGQPLTYNQLLAKGREALEKEFRKDPVARMELGFNFAQQYLRVEDGFTSDTLLRTTVAIADSLGDPRWQGRARCELLQALEEQHLGDSALATLKAARAFLARASYVDRGTEDACDMGESQALIAAKRAREAAPFLARVLERYRAADDTLTEGYLYKLNSYARALFLANDARSALPILERIIQSARNGDAADPRSLWVSIANEGATLGSLGELHAREEFFRTQLRLSPDLPPSLLADIALNFSLLDQPDSAEALYRRALEGVAMLDDRRICTAHLRLARIAHRAGREDEAIRQRADAATLCEANKTAAGVRVINAVSRIEAAADKGDRATLLGVIQAGLDSLGYPHDSTSAFLIEPLLSAAAALENAGDHGEASRYAGSALRIAAVDSLAWRQSGYAGAALLAQARAALGQGHQAEGKALVARAIPPLEHGFGPERPVVIAARRLRDSLDIRP